MVSSLGDVTEWFQVFEGGWGERHTARRARPGMCLKLASKPPAGGNVARLAGIVGAQPRRRLGGYAEWKYHKKACNSSGE